MAQLAHERFRQRLALHLDLAGRDDQHAVFQRHVERGLTIQIPTLPEPAEARKRNADLPFDLSSVHRHIDLVRQFLHVRGLRNERIDVALGQKQWFGGFPLIHRLAKRLHALIQLLVFSIGHFHLRQFHWLGIRVRIHLVLEEADRNNRQDGENQQQDDTSQAAVKQTTAAFARRRRCGWVRHRSDGVGQRV